uniref:Fanconi-associated nuclease n=1 Tax=Arcella intermedia TaxID=1963864 RepID=A0A6B2KZY2_9EUKA
MFRRIHRLFFLNRSEDAEVMLLVDFGHLKYPTYFYLNNHQKPTNQKPKQKELIKYEDYDSEADTIVSEELPPISTKRALITIDLSDSEDTVVDNVASVPQKPQEPCLVRSGTLSKESITTMNMAKLKPKSVFPNREALEKYECALSLAEQFTEIVAQNSGDNGKKYVLSVEIMDQLNTITQTFKQDLKTLGIKYKEKIYENEKAKVELPDYQKLTGMELFLKRFSAGYVIASVLIVGISLLEKCRCYPKAIDLCLLLLHSPYIIHRRGHVWQRLVVDLIHSKKKSRAIKLLKVALSDMTLSKHIRYALQIKLVSLWKPPLRLGAFPKDLLVLGELREAPAVYIRGTSIIKTVGKKSVFVGYNDQSCSVEELALQFYKASDGWSGIHCEGSPFLTIFGLIFWEIIYDASIPHVFQTPYQTSPLDFGTESFYLSRKDAIENVLSMIRSDEPLSSSSVVTTSSQASPIIPSQSVTPSPEYPATITTDLLTQSYNNYRGIQSRFVDWDKCLPLSFLCNLCCCIGGNVLSVILRVMAKEASISGMPDLILYKEKERISKFVEVKGPRDRLSDKQRVWIDTLLEAGADVQVLHVTDKDKQDCKDDDIDFSDL